MYTTILHATDLSENHYDLCQRAVKFAKSIHASIHFLHVIEIPSSLQWAQSLGFAELAAPVREDAATVMAALGDDLEIPASHQYIEIGTPSLHILNKIKEIRCDLVILGERSTNHLSFVGSTVQTVIHHASCDVLTLNNGSSA